MKYVLDASVALKWVLPEPLADKARNLRVEFQQGIHEFLSPDVFVVEVGNALTRAERKRIIPVGDSGILLARILNTRPVLHASLSLLSRAVTISSNTRLSVYDCLYLVLAEENGCEFVTADQKLVDNLRGSTSIIHLSEL